MKRINRVIIAAVAASMALVSCVDENLLKPEETVIKKDGARVITVSFNQTTKTTLDGFQPEFAEGDTIKISNGVSAPENRLVKIDDHGNAYITTDLMGALTAVYPASAADINSNGKQIDGIKVPATQSGRFASANICMAEIQDAATTATFVNQVAILKFYVDKSIGVKKITVTSTSGNLASSSTTITVDPNDDATINTITDDPEGRICYVAVLPGQKGSLKFTSETTTQGSVERIFTADVALDKNGMYNAFIPYYIDLGKAGKWAYCNIGAFFPEEPGKYFAWGDTEGQTWNGSSWSGSGFDAAPTVTNDPAILPWKDGSTNYDAANVAWGDSWCMPTKAQLDSLAIDSRVWDDTRKGYNIYTTSADTAIFLPAAAGSEDMSNIKSNGHYWSSSLNGESENKGKSYAMSFDNAVVTVSDVDRKNGYTIRPVKTVKITKLELDATAELKLKKGETVTKALTLKITPANATNQKVTWTSSATSYATVDSTGLVTAVAKGTATITAKIIDVDGKEWSKTCTVTVKPDTPEGAIATGTFTVNAKGEKVYFSKGNLQAKYNGSQYTWGFAANQYDFIGGESSGSDEYILKWTGNNRINNPQNGDIVDLFSWSTATTTYGIRASSNNSDYSGDFKDWGTAIDNEGTWRTLEHEEWVYILDTRTVKNGTGKDHSYSFVKYNNVFGLAIYPDDFKGDILSSETNYSELPDGIVFLPQAGARHDKQNPHFVTEFDSYGHYWSATQSNNEKAYRITFQQMNSGVYLSLDEERLRGLSVRLVTDVK